MVRSLLVKNSTVPLPSDVVQGSRPKCHICGSENYTESSVHQGWTVRLDCADCWQYDRKGKEKWRPFIAFARWHEEENPY